jgi:hypothetical protein
MKNCKGCYSYGKNDCFYIGRTEEGTVNCPCMICLIKGVCYRACEEYEDFTMKIRLRLGQRVDDIPKKIMEL